MITLAIASIIIALLILALPTIQQRAAIAGIKRGRKDLNTSSGGR